ncbi:MAG: citryl-CoA lyase [bacterium]|nr:citryl-CoA lyase [bacterium]
MSQKEKKTEAIHSRIWEEEPEADNPFAAAACYCHGYDVYGDLLGKAGWIEYLYLLFMGERPREGCVQLLEGLAVALANPGPRAYSVRAAMTAGASTATTASSLMSAIAVNTGNLQGSQELMAAMTYWHTCGMHLDKWLESLKEPPRQGQIDTRKDMEHIPGFDPHGVSCPAPVRQVLSYLSGISRGTALPWLSEHRTQLETAAGSPLSMVGVAAAAFVDLGMTPEQAEMLYLVLCLPGAAAHALEQRKIGKGKYPFFNDGLVPVPYKK